MFGARCSVLEQTSAGPPTADRRKIALAILAAAAAWTATGCFGRQYRSGPRVAVVGGDPIVQMKAPGAFPIVTKPSLVSPRLHSDPPDENSRVLGLSVGAVPRAYPIGLLDRFEVVNDAVPGLSFVVVRCGLTGITAAYDRAVGGRVLAFRNSGALWRDTLVLRDRETGTYWSSATGAALYGPLAGERLRPLPALVVRASDWERGHPGSLYMDLDEDTSEPLWMRVYKASQWQGVSGGKTRDARHKPKEPVFTVGEDGEAIAFTAGEVEAARRIEASVSGRRISIRWDDVLEVPRAYGEDGSERAVVPMFWFAAARHYAHIRTLGSPERTTGQ